MPRLNYEIVKQKGFNDSQIDEYLKRNPTVQIYNRSQQPITTPEAKSVIQTITSPVKTPTVPITPILAQKAPITQEFMNYNPKIEKYSGGYNRGVDIGVPVGTQLNLPQGKWEVVEEGTGFNRGYGNSIMVKNTQTGERLRFSHLSKMQKLQPGQQIEGGNLLALTGATGNTTGPHLDLEYYNSTGQLQDVLRSPYSKMLYPQQ